MVSPRICRKCYCTSFLELSLYMYNVMILYLQLGNLERKWQHHEQNNFVMKECILCIIEFIGGYEASSMN